MHRMLAVISLCLLQFTGSALLADPGAQEVHVAAERFRFQPSHIVVMRSRPVVLRIESRDVLHGFSIPALNIRVDLEPGKTVTVRLPAMKPGRYPFLCTIFCGSGHGSMHGLLEVR